jgi:hypothetical protein
MAVHVGLRSLVKALMKRVHRFESHIFLNAQPNDFQYMNELFILIHIPMRIFILNLEMFITWHLFIHVLITLYMNWKFILFLKLIDVYNISFTQLNNISALTNTL